MKNFTQTPNEVLRDESISLQAKGLYALIASKPQGWEFSGRRLARESSNGFDSLNRAIHELERVGYLIRSKLPTGKTQWELCPPDSENQNQANPNTENQNQGKPDSENPKLGKPQVGKTSTISNTEKEVIRKKKAVAEGEFLLESDETETPDEILLEFPCQKTGEVWQLTKQRAEQLAETFPKIDILANARIARQWAIDNQGKRKTPRGMPNFLSGWISRSLNRGQAIQLPADGVQEWQRGKNWNQRFNSDRATDTPPLKWSEALREFFRREGMTGPLKRMEQGGYATWPEVPAEFPSEVRQIARELKGTK